MHMAICLSICQSVGVVGAREAKHGVSEADIPHPNQTVHRKRVSQCANAHTGDSGSDCKIHERREWGFYVSL